MTNHILNLFKLCLGLAAICGPTSKVQAAPDKIKVGVILPLTGAFARYGAKIRESISKFSSDSIEFIYEDEGCDPKVAITAYKKLSEIDKVNYFIGPWCGSPQSVVAPQLKLHKQLAVVGSSAPSAVFPMSDGRMFSTQHSIEDESTYLAKQVSIAGEKTIVIVFKENSFSRAHEAAFREHFKGKILETFAYNSEDISELKTIAIQVKKLKPDALYVPDAFPLMAGLVKELNNIGITNIPLYSVYSVQSDDVLNVLGKSGESLIYSYPSINQKVALEIFPSLAAKNLTDAVNKCRADVECAKNYLISTGGFDKNGVLPGGLTLKTIRDGEFVVYQQ